jgi:glycosyltransferase involved in cell wall biosynthesis
MLNRRDIGNPSGGGAEVYVHEIARGLIEQGDEVTIFSSRFRGAAADETIDNVRHVRGGNELTVHFRGFFYAWRHRKQFDLIIDTYNGLGFFCFLIPGSMLLIFQMYREFWFRELGPAGILPYAVEPLLLRLYRKMRTITISDSTKSDLEGLGFGDVAIVLVAIGNRPVEMAGVKETDPTMIFLGRLRSTKRPEDSIRIFGKVKSRLPGAKLWIIGRGPEEDRLRKMAGEIDGVTFYGWVDEERKFELLRRAHVLVVPGVREGFGINVIEAASQGTPSVGYNVHGLRDSIFDGRTGLLADDPVDAADKVLRLLGDTEFYSKMAKECLEYSGGFNWKQRAEEFRRAIGPDIS